MQQRHRFLIAVSGTVLAGTLALGAAATAAGDDEGGATRRPQLTTEERCAKSDEIILRAGELQAKIDERIPMLETRRAEAEAAGEAARVERLDRRLARLQRVSERIPERIATVETWVAEHCTT